MERNRNFNNGARPKSFKQESTDEFTGEHGTTAYPEFSASNFSYELNEGIEACKSKMNIFKRKYLIWDLDRKGTISELMELADKVHEEQLTFNSTHLFFKKINSGSRKMKTDTDSNLDTLASMSTFITDAIDGITSVVQACNVDWRMKKFGEIMERDAENTKLIYAARSECFDYYRNVEEIIRKYHSETFSTTWDKIAKAINTEAMWLELKNEKQNKNDLSNVMEKVDVFFQQLSRIETLIEIRSSLSNYINNNPAVLEACESSGKAFVGLHDICTKNSKDRNNLVSRSLNTAANQALIFRTDSEIDRLQRLVSNDQEPQAKLETQIRDAIHDLEKEAIEMRELYENCDTPLQSNLNLLS